MNCWRSTSLEAPEGYVCGSESSPSNQEDLWLWAVTISNRFPLREINYSKTSKVAYFKRKYAEEEDLHGDKHGYFPKHLIRQEDRSCILKLSLEKLRFLEDPEAYLRRSVLINNLLRKIHHDEEHHEAEEEEEEERQGNFDRGPGRQRLLYPDRKRVKVVVADCCSQSFGLKDIPHYHLVAYMPLRPEHMSQYLPWPRGTSPAL